MSDEPANGAATPGPEADGSVDSARYPQAVGGYRWDLRTHTANFSPELVTLFGLGEEQFADDPRPQIQTRVHPADMDALREATRAVIEDGEPHPMSFRIVLPNGRVRLVWTAGDVERDDEGNPVALVGRVIDMGQAYSHRHIADARLRLLEYSIDHSLDELLQRTLDEAELLSDSRIGFYHFIDADQVNLTLQSWSTRTKEENCRAEGKGEHYPVAQAGVWVDCVYARAPVIHNDYASLANKKGLPEGHAELVRELVVPVIRQGRVCAILGVGNKQVDYDETDVEAVAMLADLAWDIAERKATQVALEESEQRFRLLFETMNEGVIFQNADGRIVSSNASAQRMLGLTAEQMSSRTSLDPRWRSIHEDGSEFPGSEHPTMVALRTGKPVLDVTVGLYNPIRRQTRWMLVGAVPLFRAGSVLPHEAFLTMSDITELKRSREEVERTLELLTGLKDATSHLLSHASISDTDVAAALRAIAVAFGVECAYIYQNQDPSGVAATEHNRSFVWLKSGKRVVEPPSEDGQRAAFERWHDRFASGDIVELRTDELDSAERDELESRGVSSSLAVPVFSEARLWGFVALEASGGPRGWEPSEIETVRTAASRLGNTIELSNLAVRDPLTGMYNRRYLDESLGQTLARAQRDGTPLAVIQFDIDDFKGINDRLGHAAGDSVLRELADRLRQHTRTQDTAARIGGDEFLVVMPGATAKDAAESAERWCRFVESDSATWDVEGNPTVTISAGISSTSTAHTREELLAQSDHAMFDAKNAGRNRVLRFG